jgi:hypothetical protein
MSTSSNALPTPTPDAGANAQPTLTVIPPPAPARRAASRLHQAQVRDLAKAEQICWAAQKPEYAEVLARHQVDEAFVTALLNDIHAARQKSSAAVDSTAAKKDAVASEQAAAGALMRSLRQTQAAARQLHQFADPAKLQSYHVGERIDANRPVLDQCSQGIIAQAGEERPPGIDTAFIERAETERAAYLNAQSTRASARSRARAERSARDAQVESIQQRRMQLQFAAEAAWPAGVPAHAAVRTEFCLPAERPYTG